MSHRILIIDDTEDIRAIAGMALELSPDLIVRTCGSGAEGLQIAENWQPDLILLDVQMPVLGGPETLALLRSGARTASIPVVFFTASVQKHDNHQKDALLELGAQGLISKPFDPMALAGQVEPFLQASAASLGAQDLAKDGFPTLQDDEKSLLYVSRSLLGTGDQQGGIKQIVATAQAKNEHRDITGALIFTNKHFAQYLEGPTPAVDQLMAAIKQDPRHTNVHIIDIPRFSRRYFVEWRMAHGGSSRYVAELVEDVFTGQSGSVGPEKLIRLMRELTNDVSQTALPAPS